MKLNKPIIAVLCSIVAILTIKKRAAKKRLDDLISAKEEMEAPYKLEPAEL